MTPKRTATADRITSDHVLKSQPEDYELNAAFAAQLRQDRMLADFVAVALSDDEFDALNAQETENRAAADDDFAMFR